MGPTPGRRAAPWSAGGPQVALGITPLRPAPLVTTGNIGGNQGKPWTEIPYTLKRKRRRTSRVEKTRVPAWPVGSQSAPIRQNNPAALNDGFHGTDRKDAATVIRDDHLFPANWISPFLVAPRLTCQRKIVPLENRYDLIRVQPGRSPLTQS